MFHRRAIQGRKKIQDFLFYKKTSDFFYHTQYLKSNLKYLNSRKKHAFLYA